MPTEVALSTDAYRNWLRAQRPPFEWFAQLGPAEQKALADIGDEERERAHLELAYMIRDPEASEAILTGDETVAEQVAVDRLARAAVQAAVGMMPAAPATPYHQTEPITMAGATRRRSEPKGPTMFGKVAD